MGSFSSGTEGLDYNESYCFRCQNWRAAEWDETVKTCPIWELHELNAMRVTESTDEVRDLFIPRDKTGIYNQECRMFLPTADAIRGIRKILEAGR